MERIKYSFTNKISQQEAVPFAVKRRPFLICECSQFPALRQRAARELWGQMRTDAVRLNRFPFAATVLLFKMLFFVPSSELCLIDARIL